MTSSESEGDHATQSGLRIIDPHTQLAFVAAQLHDSGTTAVSVRTFLSWFGAYRRGYYKVKEMRRALAVAGLETVPDFESAYIDSLISFVNASGSGMGDSTDGGASGIPSDAMPDARALPPTPAVMLSGASADPTYRIGKLAAANHVPTSVKPESSLQEAVTLMLSHDYSQLPVMQSEFTVKGILTWTGIGSRLALNQSGDTVTEFMDPAQEISADTSLFAAISTIVSNQYVLIRDSKNSIAGIVTTSDLSLQFGQLGEPFLLLGEIENHVRRLIDGKFTVDEVKAARDPNDIEREVKSVADLTFGEYVRLLAEPERWIKLGLAVDRAVFTKQLEQVRGIRNDVMHFDPDGVSTEDMSTLRRFGRFLAILQHLGAT
jgi:CBS domain-containing protein